MIIINAFPDSKLISHKEPFRAIIKTGLCLSPFLPSSELTAAQASNYLTLTKMRHHLRKLMISLHWSPLITPFQMRIGRNGRWGSHSLTADSKQNVLLGEAIKGVGLIFTEDDWLDYLFQETQW